MSHSVPQTDPVTALFQLTWQESGVLSKRSKPESKAWAVQKPAPEKPLDGLPGTIVALTRLAILNATSALTKISKLSYSFFSRVSEALTFLRAMEAMTAVAKSFLPVAHFGFWFMESASRAWLPATAPAQPQKTFNRPEATGHTLPVTMPVTLQPDVLGQVERALGRQSGLSPEMRAACVPFAVMAFAFTTAFVQTAPQIAALFPLA